ncbi:hypothetical protein JTE90_024993 [Oedothorax gibbosus]|uniref:Protein-L-isoaspartate O-methyltransferase domain-containing protein 1 n=1 Tax=Oedothorax gibbosus TaxID=931172 RepID=A0AAV6VWV2_9ARAC|nr:hypothetical protein JTE90_024993 [Oedothorax gibbosus]
MKPEAQTLITTLVLRTYITIKMGGTVSTGTTNDELIDHLVEAEFIKTPMIQRVFRAVDRANYYIASQKQNAYKDIAWKMGKLHLSAPCVYSVVMEALRLRAGLSFLNLGSGSGYLSTMAGLILGPYGINHGVELYSEIVDFAYERLEEFLKNSNAIDEHDFCEPTFTVGNCLKLDSSCQQYDRVYCGASCPVEYEPYLKSLIKVGGILIMPLNEKLLKITRTSERRFHVVKLLSVSFTPLISPISNIMENKDTSSSETVKLGDISPPKLQQICRSRIRTILRGHIDIEHPNLKRKQLKKERRPQVQRIVIPFYESDMSTSSSDTSDLESDSDAPEEYTVSTRIPSRMSVFIEDFLRRHAELQLLRDIEEQRRSIRNSNSSSESEDGETHNRPGIETGPVRTVPENDSSNGCLTFFTVSTQLGSSDESSNFMQPPSKSTRSQKKKHIEKMDSKTPLPGTSSKSIGKGRKKVKRASAVAGTSSTSVGEKRKTVKRSAEADTSSQYTQTTLERELDSDIEYIGEFYGESGEAIPESIGERRKKFKRAAALAGTSSTSVGKKRKTIKQPAEADTSSNRNQTTVRIELDRNMEILSEFLVERGEADSESIGKGGKKVKHASAVAGTSSTSAGEKTKTVQHSAEADTSSLSNQTTLIRERDRDIAAKLNKFVENDEADSESIGKGQKNVNPASGAAGCSTSVSEERKTVKRSAETDTSSQNIQNTHQRELESDIDYIGKFSGESDEAVFESIGERRKKFKRAAAAGKSSENTGKSSKKVKRTSKAVPGLQGTRKSKVSKVEKKVKRTSATVVWKKQLEKDKKGEEESPDTENYSEFMVAKIGALPLPSLLLRYLNYKRENL